jgi:hypothetical protein
MIFEHPDGLRLEVGGFQPFEAYDTALANLDPTLDRRPAPESVVEALEAFPNGLTTAELASVMRRSDLVDADRDAARQEAESLAHGDGLVAEQVGQDAIWRLAAQHVA